MAPLAKWDKITSFFNNAKNPEILTSLANSTGFFKNAKNLEILAGLAKNTHDAMVDYQVCTHTSSA